MSQLKDLISGGTGGMALVAVGHPLDTIKVRVQTTNLYSGTLDCAKQIIKKEGALGLYKGMAAPIVGVTPMYALCFLGYGFGQDLQTKKGMKREDLSLFQIWNAGCVAGVFTTAIIVPGERAKVLLQIQGAQSGPPKYAGPIDCIKQVYGEAGIRGVYRGTAGTLLRDVPGSGAYFAGYELFKRWLTPEGGDPNKLNPTAVIAAGGMAGVLNWLVALPADTIKNRLQSAPEGTYTGVWDVFKKLTASEGYGALYRGFTPVMLRAFPANAACFLGVEVALKVMSWVGL